MPSPLNFCLKPREKCKVPSRGNPFKMPLIRCRRRRRVLVAVEMMLTWFTAPEVVIRQKKNTLPFSLS